MSSPIKFKVCMSANAQKLLYKSEAGKWQDLIKQGEKPTKPGESLNEFTHQIWGKSDQLFICKCAETGQS